MRFIDLFGLVATFGAVSGAVCASILAKNGVSVTMFESARGPGGRMSQRRYLLSWKQSRNTRILILRVSFSEKLRKMGGSCYLITVLLTSLLVIQRFWGLFTSGNQEALLLPGMKSLVLLTVIPRNFLTLSRLVPFCPNYITNLSLT